MSKSSWYVLPDNYIYISHLGEEGEYWIIPTYPDSIQDTMSSTFDQTNALSRSAPVFTYVNSGPRQMQISLHLHRDMMDDVNLNKSNAKLEIGQDYIDSLIKKLQSIALPKYNLNNRAVEPPLAAIRISNEIFIKGVVTGGVNVTYDKPILNNGKYAQVYVSFQIYETDPYDATTVEKNGSFRGLTRGMRKGFNLETETL